MAKRKTKQVYVSTPTATKKDILAKEKILKDLETTPGWFKEGTAFWKKVLQRHSASSYKITANSHLYRWLASKAKNCKSSEKRQQKIAKVELEKIAAQTIAVKVRPTAPLKATKVIKML